MFEGLDSGCKKTVEGFFLDKRSFNAVQSTDQSELLTATFWTFRPKWRLP